MANLDEMAEKAEAAWAHSVQSIRGAVNLIDIGVVARSSASAWRIEDYLVTAGDGKYYCDCNHVAFDHPKLGRLCKHVIAAMFHARLDVAEARTVLSVVRDLEDGGLAIRRYYSTEERFIVGYANGFRVTKRFAPSDYIQVRRAELNNALYSLGWSMSDLPRKMSGVEWLYVFGIRKDKSGSSLTRDIWDMRQVTPYMAERHKQEDFLLHSFSQSLGVGD